jgi:hypothetical protein
VSESGPEFNGRSGHMRIFEVMIEWDIAEHLSGAGGGQEPPLRLITRAGRLNAHPLIENIALVLRNVLQELDLVEPQPRVHAPCAMRPQPRRVAESGAGICLFRSKQGCFRSKCGPFLLTSVSDRRESPI